MPSQAVDDAFSARGCEHPQASTLFEHSRDLLIETSTGSTMHRLIRTLATISLLLSPSVLLAQEVSPEHSGELTASVVMFNPSSDQAEACGHVALGVALQGSTAGRRYLAGFAEAYGQGFGSSRLCVGYSEGESVIFPNHGGLDPDGLQRLGAAAGWREAWGWLGLGSELRAGLIRGRPGWSAPERDAGRNILPWVGYATHATLFDLLVLKWELGWTRLHFEEEVHPSFGNDGVGMLAMPGQEPFELRSVHRWSRFGDFGLGVKFRIH